MSFKLVQMIAVQCDSCGYRWDAGTTENEAATKANDGFVAIGAAHICRPCHKGHLAKELKGRGKSS